MADKKESSVAQKAKAAKERAKENAKRAPREVTADTADKREQAKDKALRDR